MASEGRRGLILPARRRRAGLTGAHLLAAGAAMLLGLALAGCTRGGEDQRPTRPAAEVLQDYSDSLFAISGVRGTGVTDWRNEEVIIVIVNSRETAEMDRIPDRLEGHTVLVLDEEEIRRWGGL